MLVNHDAVLPLALIERNARVCDRRSSPVKRRLRVSTGSERMPPCPPQADRRVGPPFANRVEDGKTVIVADDSIAIGHARAGRQRFDGIGGNGEAID